MTTSPRDDHTTHDGAADSAHLAALPSSPLAAYALGMLHMLQRTPAAADCGPSACEAMRESDAIARSVLAFLDDARVPLSEKRALVVTIEHASDVADVQRVLHLHAIADGSSQAAQHWNEASETIGSQEDAPVGNQEEKQEATECEELADAKCELIPEALGCSICCDELMLKPVSLLCGHSFCKRCVDMWLKSCANCPTCRQPVSAVSAMAVNVALQELMTTFFPDKLKQLEDRDNVARLDGLRALIAQAIASGQSIRDLVAQQQQNPFGDNDQKATQADVSHLLESDPALQQQVLAAEIRERLRKEKALREASRRRHMIAYCGTLPPAARAHAQRIHNSTLTATPPPAPTPSVQSHRPVKKYVPPPPKKSAFFGNLLRRLHHDDTGSSGH